jgi:hypothetical protein
MGQISGMLADSDLHFIIGLLIPECRDRQAMVRTLRKDREILRGMLLDERLLNTLTQDDESFVKVSPYLFFTVLLERTRHELEHQSYTIERSRGQQMAVFDSRAVVELLGEKRVSAYLTHMLVSFIKIHSVSIPVRVKKGVWRKLRFSDFDIESLIKYSEMLEESQRFGVYKRIADICLFVTGIFPEHIDAQKSVSSFSRARLGIIAQWGREGMEKWGAFFYERAAQHAADLQYPAQLQELREVLFKLSESFILASKPLNYISDRYLGFQKAKYFPY